MLLLEGPLLRALLPPPLAGAIRKLRGAISTPATSGCRPPPAGAATAAAAHRPLCPLLAARVCRPQPSRQSAAAPAGQERAAMDLSEIPTENLVKEVQRRLECR